MVRVLQGLIQVFLGGVLHKNFFDEGTQKKTEKRIRNLFITIFVTLLRVKQTFRGDQIAKPLPWIRPHCMI